MCVGRPTPLKVLPRLTPPRPLPGDGLVRLPAPRRLPGPRDESLHHRCPQPSHRAPAAPRPPAPDRLLRGSALGAGRSPVRAGQGDTPCLLPARGLHLAGGTGRRQAGPGGRHGRPRGHAGRATGPGRDDSALACAGAGCGNGLPHRHGGLSQATGAEHRDAAHAQPLPLRDDGAAGGVCGLPAFSPDRSTPGALAADEPGPRPHRPLPHDPGIPGLHAGRTPRRHHCGGEHLAAQRADRVPPRGVEGARPPRPTRRIRRHWPRPKTIRALY